MGTSSPSEADILSTWPEPRPRIQGMPTFQALRALEDYCKTNVMKIDTTLGGGAHGHLFLVLSAPAWALLAPAHAPFVPPAAPANIPTYPDNVTSGEIAEIRAIFDEEVRLYTTYRNCKSALRTVILAAVDPIYVRALRDPTTHFDQLSPRQILDHLFDSYGQLPPQEIVKLLETMKKPWDPTQPFEVVIDQIEEACDIASAARQPFTTAQVLNIAYVLVHSTGLMGDACREWRKLPPADQDWPRFKQHFIEATIQLRLDQDATSGHHGYANAMEMLNRLADAASADKLTVANLTAANSDLSAANTTMIAQLRDLTNQMATLQTELAALKNSNASNHNNNNNYRGYRPRRGPWNPNKTPHTSNYCWSHGALVGDGHTSATCRTPRPGHQKEATRDNLDSAATGHYLRLNTSCLHSIRPVSDPIIVSLPDGTPIQPTHQGLLPLPALPEDARTAYLFPDLHSYSLLSVPILCDHGCDVSFNNASVIIRFQNRIILSGSRLPNGLYQVELPVAPQSAVPSNLQVNNVYESTTISDMVAYLHAAAFSPSISTFLAAIQRGFFTTWPGLTAENVRKHLPKSIATALGHLDQQRKNIRSTRPTPTPIALVDTPVFDDNSIADPDSLDSHDRTHDLFVAIVDMASPTGLIFSDQTGAFPRVSLYGNKYVMIVYDYDSNAILKEPLKSRQANDILRAFSKIYDHLAARGHRPKIQRLDNEISNALKNFLKKKQVDYQLTPAGIHRRNAAERAIRTFKNHFIAGLASTDRDFPLQLWDQLLDQAELTLNLLRPSRINPRLSAHAQLNGAFDFNRTPLAPPGTRVVAHVKAQNRNTWATHGLRGWYVGPAPEHYRCYRIWIPETNAARICDTVEFFPSHVKMPKLSSIDAATHAARDLISALANPHPAAPFLKVGDQQLEAIRELANIFSAALPRVEPKKFPPAAAAAAMTASSLPSQNIPDTPLETLCERPAPQHPWNFFAAPIFDPDTGRSLEYRDLIKDPRYRDVWTKSAANEFGRLAQGVGGRVHGTDTIQFITKAEVPRNKIPTYGRFVCEYRPQKSEPHRTRLTVGGNRIDYPGDKHTPTADLTTFKLHVNSVLSTPGARMACFDIKNFYLGTPLPDPEFMKLHHTLIPDEIMTEYRLHAKVDDRGFIYIRIEKGMYGLPQAGILANQQLAQRLGKHGFYQSRHTPGFWKHTTQPISFCLVVDDFAVKYIAKADANHLLTLLQRDYEAVSTDWDAKLFGGITLTWDYEARTCDLSLPGYVKAAVEKFGHQPPAKPQHAPHRYSAPQYGKKVQTVEPPDESPPLSKDEITKIRQIVGTALFYSRAVDPTLLMTLSELASQQEKATERTKADARQLLDYWSTHPDAIIRYKASDMELEGHSDASYLTSQNARSRVGGHWYLTKESDPTFENGPVLDIAGILRLVASAASEAEIGGLFVNMKEAIILRQTLHDMGHPQGTTKIITDNSTASGIANATIKPNRSRAIDMRYHWVRDRVREKDFSVEWQPGQTNLADYFTKHHSPAHHQRMRSKYLHCPATSETSELKLPEVLNHILALHCEGVLNFPPGRRHLPAQAHPCGSAGARAGPATASKPPMPASHSSP